MRALRTRRNRDARGRFVAEGVRVVEDLLTSPLRVRWTASSSSLEDTERGRALVDTIAARGLPRRVVDEAEFAALAATESPQGILAVAEIPRPLPEAISNPGEPCVALVLDGVQDPGNFGTLIRSAEALGAQGVVVLPGTVDPWNPKAVRAAAGSSFRVPIVQLSWPEALGLLRNEGFVILGADAKGRAVNEVKADRVAIVLGNEGGGLSDEVRTSVDAFAAVPLLGRAESLNVAAAGAILLYELSR